MSNIEDLINELEFGDGNQIQCHIICKECMAEVHCDPELVPETYSRLAVGYTDEGLQVWCLRHQRSVIELELENNEWTGRLPY